MLEDLALLDVELEESAKGPRVPGRLDMVGVKVAALEHLVERMAFLVVQPQKVIVRELAAHGPAAERRRREAARLLAEEQDDLERPPRREAVFPHRADRLNRREDADNAVEVAALRHAVAMRTEHNSGQALIRALHMADDIAEGILAQLHARLAHQAHQIRAPLPIRIRERQPVDALPRRCDVLQICELLLQARS